MIVRTPNWSDPAQRRLEALRSLQERDFDKLLELVRAYVGQRSRKQSRTSSHTIRSYKTGITDFLNWLWPQGSAGPRLHLHRCTAEELRAYLLELQTRPPQKHRKHRRDGHAMLPPEAVQPATVQNYLAGVRVLLKALEWAGVNRFTLEELVAPPDPTPPENRRPALPEVTYKQELLHHLEGDEPEQLRMRLVVRLMGEMGLRISEVCGLETDKIDLATRLLEVRGKGGKLRPVPIPKGLVGELRQWLKLRTVHARAGVKELIINLGNRRAKGLGTKPDQIRKQLEALYKELHLPERYRGAHMLRHTAGTRIYKRNNKDLMSVARILGHTNLNTSAIYAKMDAEGLLEAMDNAEG